VPGPLDYYRRPKPDELSGFRWFWAGLWPEVRSEFAEIPAWLLIFFGGLALALVGSVVFAIFAVTLS
jgi:hypothetical protein